MFIQGAAYASLVAQVTMAFLAYIIVQKNKYKAFCQISF